MQTSLAKRKDYVVILYLLLLTLLAHGLALFNNSVYWDGALVYGFYQENNLEQLRLITFSMGEPLFYYIERLLWWLGFGFICNLVGVLSIYCVALFSYQSARLFHSINKLTAILIGTFIILYPGSMITFYHATINYYILYALFSVAFYLGLKMETIKNIENPYIYRIISLLLFFLSFSLKSLLVYYLLFIVCAYIIYSKESYALFLNSRNAISFMRNRVDFFCLPFVFWLLCQAFFKPYNDYSAYNSFQSFHLIQFLYYLFFSIEFTVLRMVWVPAVIFLLVLIIYSVTKYGQRDVSSIPPYRFTLEKFNSWLQWSKPYIGLLFLGGVALLLAILPYLLVGKELIYDTWPESRFSLLVSPSISIMMAGLVGMVFIGSNEKLTFLGKWFVIIFSAYFIMLWFNNYLRLEAESALKKSIVAHLKQNKSWENNSIYWMVAEGFNKNLQPAFVSYEWAWLLNEAYGGHSRYGLNEKPMSAKDYRSYKGYMSITYQKNRHNVRNLNVNGCQAILTITPGTNWIESQSQYTPPLKLQKVIYVLNPGFHGVAPLRIGLSYLYYRFIKPQDMDDFLFHLTNIEMTPFPSSEALDCKTIASN